MAASCPCASPAACHLDPVTVASPTSRPAGLSIEPAHAPAKPDTDWTWAREAADMSNEPRKISMALMSIGSFSLLLGDENTNSTDEMLEEAPTLLPPSQVATTKLCSAYVISTTTLLGVGTLAVPLAMSDAGLLGYEIVIVAMMSLNFVTADWLVEVIDKLPASVQPSYEGIARSQLGHVSAFVVSMVFLFAATSLCISRMLFISSSLVAVFSQWQAGQREEDELLSLGGHAAIWIRWALGILVILPLALLKDISKLRYSSGVGVLALVVACTFVVFYNVIGLFAEPKISAGCVWLPSVFDGNFSMFMAVTTSNFSCHISVAAVYSSLGPNRSKKSMRRILLAALGTALTIYSLTAIFSYAHLGNTRHTNILDVISSRLKCKEAPSMCVFHSVAQLGVACTLAVGMPILLWAARSTILNLIRSIQASRAQQRFEPDRAAAAAEEILNSQPTFLEWTLVTVILLVVILRVSTVARDIGFLQVVMSVGGSLGGTFVSFLYPALFRLKVVNGVRSFWEVFHLGNAQELGMLAFGLTYGVVCLIMQAQRVGSLLRAASATPPTQ